MALRKRLAVIGGIGLGILTLRFLRNRRESEDETEIEHEELETATDHASAAVEHARVAASKAVEEQRQK